MFSSKSGLFNKVLFNFKKSISVGLYIVYCTYILKDYNDIHSYLVNGGGGLFVHCTMLNAIKKGFMVYSLMNKVN